MHLIFFFWLHFTKSYPNSFFFSLNSTGLLDLWPPSPLRLMNLFYFLHTCHSSKNHLPQHILNCCSQTVKKIWLLNSWTMVFFPYMTSGIAHHHSSTSHTKFYYPPISIHWLHILFLLFPTVHFQYVFSVNVSNLNFQPF